MSNDDIYEQSAQAAIRTAQNFTLDKTKRDASGAGLQARPMNESAMNDGRSYAGGAGSGPGDVQARESEANRAVVQTRRMIESTGGLDMNDFLDLEIADGGQGARDAMQMKRRLGVVAEHMVNHGAQQMVHDAYMNPNEASMLMEQEAYQPQMQASGWQVVKTAATLKSGKQIPVFVVEDTLTGMTTGKKYRLSTVAEKVARVVNATNNPSDARITMINEAYDQHVKLMQERGKANREGNSRKVQMIESKLQEVNTRLGIH